MREIVVSASAASRLARARAFLETVPPADEVVVLGASRSSVDDIARSLLATKRAFFGVHRKTLGGWASELAAPRIAHRGATIATHLALDAVVQRAIDRAIASGALEHFGADAGSGPVARAPAFPRALLSTIQDLRAAGVAPSALEGRGPRLADLARMLALYEDELVTRKLADRAELLREAAIAAADSALAKSPLVVVDVALATSADASFLRALIAAAKDVLVLAPRGDTRMLSACAGLDVVRPDGPPRTALERARANLFEAEAGERGPDDATLELMSAPSQAREAVEVVRRAVTSGAPFDEIAIVIPSRRAYGTYVETALERGGVPAYFSFGTRRPHPAGRALVALLACKLERYSARRFAEYLSLGQVPDAVAPKEAVYVPVRDETLGRFGEAEAVVDPDDEDDTEPAAAVEPAIARYGGVPSPHRWETFLGETLAAAPRERGKEYYARKLGALVAAMNKEADAIRREDTDSPALARIERDIGHASNLAAFADPVLARLDALPDAADWSVWSEQLSDLARMALRTPEVVLAALAELRTLEGSGSVTLADVAETLRSRLADLERPRPKRRYGRVFVTLPRDLRGRSFRQVFVLGLTERVFPERVHEDPLLFDDDRRSLDAEITTSERKAEDARLGLLLAAGAATERAVFSYPRVDAEVGRSRVPSFYALDLVRSFRGALPDIDEMQREATLRGEARLDWPAPPDPARAIDIFEHDLATLRPLLQPGATDVAGRARYLLEDNEHVARALRTRFSRFDRSRITPSDGLVTPSAHVLRGLAERSLKARSYSPSALQHYAACPLRFYLLTLLGVAPRREIEAAESIDPATRGELFHDVIARVARELADHGKLPVPDSGMTEALALLDTLFDEAVRRVASEIEPTVMRVFDNDCAEIREDLRTLVRFDFARGAGFEPAFAELAFGLPRRPHFDPASTVDPVRLPSGFLLKGAIDSIERSPDGKDLRVTDYKTGAAINPGVLVTGGGETLQPALYGLAAEALVGKSLPADARVTTSRLYYATRRGEHAERVVHVDADSRARTLRVLEAIEAALLEGFFPAWPRKDACKMCEVRVACGPDEEKRLERKRDWKTGIGRVHLEVLRDLRSAP